MTEELIKMLCKLMIKGLSRSLPDFEKEALKQAVDSLENWEQLFCSYRSVTVGMTPSESAIGKERFF